MENLEENPDPALDKVRELGEEDTQDLYRQCAKMMGDATSKRDNKRKSKETEANGASDNETATSMRHTRRKKAAIPQIEESEDEEDEKEPREEEIPTTKVTSIRRD